MSRPDRMLCLLWHSLVPKGRELEKVELVALGEPPFSPWIMVHTDALEEFGYREKHEAFGSLRGRRVVIGPYALRLVSWQWSYFGYWAQLDGWQARLAALLWPLRRWLRGVYYRLILTAAVWGLASWEEGAVPHWQQLYAAAWLRRRWQGWRAAHGRA